MSASSDCTSELPGSIFVHPSIIHFFSPYLVRQGSELLPGAAVSPTIFLPTSTTRVQVRNFGFRANRIQCSGNTLFLGKKQSRLQCVHSLFLLLLHHALLPLHTIAPSARFNENTVFAYGPHTHTHKHTHTISSGLIYMYTFCWPQ